MESNWIRNIQIFILLLNQLLLQYLLVDNELETGSRDINAASNIGFCCSVFLVYLWMLKSTKLHGWSHPISTKKQRKTNGWLVKVKFFHYLIIVGFYGGEGFYSSWEWLNSNTKASQMEGRMIASSLLPSSMLKLQQNKCCHQTDAIFSLLCLYS